MTSAPAPGSSPAPARSLPAGLVAAAPFVLIGLLTVLAWPIANTPARATLDGSWQIALHLAAALGLQHGVDIVFTYGPLGFLGFPHPYLGLTSSISMLVVIAIYVALIGTMLVEARRIMPLWAAFIVTFLVARIFAFLPPFEAFQALFFIWCVEALADRIPVKPSTLAVIGGALGGAALLGKVNIGLFAVAMGTVTAVIIGRPWWRGPAIFLAAIVVSSLALWLVTGQHLGDLGAYATGVYQIIAGYNAAMGADPTPDRTWIYLALAAIVAIVVWSGWQSSRSWPSRRRIGLAALGLVFGFAMWKTAMVREHMVFVSATALVAMFAFAQGIDRRTWLVGVLAIGIAFAGASAIEPRNYVNVLGSARSFVNEARDSFQPGRTEQAAARTRERLRAWYALDPATLAAIDGETVHFDPYMTSAAYAYPELRWRPVPIFQSYSAYTPELDRQNADFLRSADAPQRILRNFEPVTSNDRLTRWMGRPMHEGEFIPFTVDGRFRWFESPEMTLEMLCRYQPTSTTERWQVLARTGRSCGPAESLGTVSARAGEAVPVPVETRPDRFVTVKIGGLEPSLLGRLKAALYRGPEWYATLDDTRYRLMPGTAGDGLLLAVPPAADGTRRFAFGDPIRTIAVTQGLDNSDPHAILTYEFESVPLRGS